MYSRNTSHILRSTSHAENHIPEREMTPDGVGEETQHEPSGTPASTPGETNQAPCMRLQRVQNRPKRFDDYKMV